MQRSKLHQRAVIVRGGITLFVAIAMMGWPGLGLGEEKNLPNVSEAEVKAFAKAHVQVTRIHSVAEAEEDIPKTIAQIDAESVPHKETRERMIQAIEAEGLTLETYNELMEAYQTNEEFRSKVALKTLDLH